MTYDVDLLTHIQSVNNSLCQFGGSAELDPETLNLKLRAKGKYIELQPQFILPKDGSMAFTPKLINEAQDFCGWRPYFNRVWPIAIDKLSFKDFCRKNALSTPKQFSAPMDVDTNVIIKRSRSSFSQGIVGPFTPAIVRSTTYSANDGSYFEEFIQGTIAKIWFWDSVPVCLVATPMPTIIGDGRNSLRTLIANQSLPYFPINWNAREVLAKFQGETLDAIPIPGKRVIVDFHYLSSFHDPATYQGNQNVLNQYAGSPLLKQLQRAGEAFWGAIPAEMRNGTVFSIDAIIDERQQAHFLEMNCNPIVHPDIYPYMFETWFGTRAPATMLH
jgi:hypothetical protein